MHLVQCTIVVSHHSVTAATVAAAVTDAHMRIVCNQLTIMLTAYAQMLYANILSPDKYDSITNALQYFPCHAHILFRFIHIIFAAASVV